MIDEYELQKQVDSRCPCFAKPINECDCQADIEVETTELWTCSTCSYCGDWDYKINSMGNCTNCGNTLENI